MHFVCCELHATVKYIKVFSAAQQCVYDNIMYVATKYT